MIKEFKVSNLVREVLFFILVLIISFIILLPVFWMIVTSFKPVIEIFSKPPHWVPKAPTLDAYKDILSKVKYIKYFINSYLISGVVVLVTLVLASLAAYGFSRMKIAGKQAILFGTLVLMMFPGVVLLIPYFELANYFNLLNTYTILILVDISFVLPFCIWMLNSYMDSIPVELEEAAFVDGCNRFSAFWRIILPLMRPGLVAVGTWAFLGAWNEFMFASILTTGPDKAPITVGIAEFFGQFSMNWNAIMAVGTLASLPIMFIFIFLQRYIIQGMTAGSGK